MTRQERRKRRQQRRRARILLVLLAILVVIIVLRIPSAPDADPPPADTEEAAQEITLPPAVLTFEAAAQETPEVTQTPEIAEETPPVSRYAGLDISDHDIEILAALVYHEARGECFDGQVAVIEVVLNRCLSEYAYFPDTVEEVVFQKMGEMWQFSPAPYLWTAEPDATQYAAVHAAIYNIENVLPVNTVFFSGAPYNDNIVAIIGNHYFCSVEEVTQ